MITTILATFIFIFGLVIGSFLNVVIYRWNTSRTLGGRSACVSCRNTLCWYELIPLFSFLALKGRCRMCKSKISSIYPMVELCTGLIFLGLFYKFQNLLDLSLGVFLFTFIYYALVFSLLVVISFYDLKHKIIPDKLSLLFGILAFGGLFFFDQFGFFIHMPNYMDFLSGLIVALPFALLWLISQGRWMGLGDAKLAIGLGFLLGLSRALSGIVLSFWSGAIIGIFLVFFSQEYKIKSEIPFAPFLVLGTILAFLFDLHLFPFF
jgi:prepilin signal peptidase PulO-like enzyme (type II secretory pathway)